MIDANVPGPKPVAEDFLYIGLDVGSTTVKAVVIDPNEHDVEKRVLWSDYQRHDTKQPEKCLEFLERIERELPYPIERYRLFVTGSGSYMIGKKTGGKFVQEVNAVSLAVERLYPECGSVIELGGQDAKIIIFKEDPETGRKKKIPSMNDKCAGGTGAVIDKINAKLRIPAEELCEMGWRGVKIHPVAGKCGVFAETDINSLQKQGTPNDEMMASLFDAIVQQNLSVLTRGNTLRPHVLLLGGPNTYIKGMRECWEDAIPQVWKERKFPLPEGVEPKSLIRVPDNAQYFAAIGAVEYGLEEELPIGCYEGTAVLAEFVHGARDGGGANKKGAGRGLAKDAAELAAFKERFKREPFTAAQFQPGEVVEAFIGVDGGSTSTKGVLLSKDRTILAKAYQLSKGNPIEDTVEIFGKLSEQVTEQGATLKVIGVGTTGYAKDVLKDVLSADVALVETVAHMESALHFYDNADVIVDVGGQDIKLIILKNGRVKDFKLNTQCSAGNGYFLQGTAATFGYTVEEFADIAFEAENFPEFGYGCAVFMQSDIVDFQRQGWKAGEIMAGLANVLPKNIWLYVSQIPNLAKLGTNFVLQGGTQYNLAAVKAQVDFIESRFRDDDVRPNVWVHKHAGESGAIGCALEAQRLWAEGRQTSFIGLEATAGISFTTTRAEGTRCYFCKNKCLRTFIDYKVAKTAPVNPNQPPRPRPTNTKIPLEADADRLIIATCEKGEVEDVGDMRAIKKWLDQVKGENPNLVELGARAAFKSFRPESVADPIPEKAWTEKARARAAKQRARADLKIGIPRVLNLYSTAPFFTAYFESLGIPFKNLIWSDYTNEELYKSGSKRGAIDPCFPSKVGIAHVHNLIHKHHPRKKLDWIFFPMIDALTSPLEGVQAHRSCPTVTTTPAAVKAAFTKEGDVFAQNGIRFFDPFLELDEPHLVARRMNEAFGELLGLSEEEANRAADAGFKALSTFEQAMRDTGREVIEMLEAEDRIGIVVLARPYHNDPGINHEIMEEFQKAGYPVLWQDALPIDDDILEPLFGDDVRRGDIAGPMHIDDVWKNSYSENTSRKLWAAKFAARHPNLVALELSSFKCGHDAPIYSVVEEIIENSDTPYFCFKDIDENKPTGSIKIRVETMTYFLTRYREDLAKRRQGLEKVDAQMAAFEARLRAGLVGITAE
ncbi:MAG: BadF/BadG/BcrA/BcrD ATPase family protein [Planctomycetota bacterium]|jgi:predicted CoA-substrate-specific enzyme activase